MDRLFWRQAYGDDWQAWLDTLDDDATRRFALLNYGPWDRLDANKPFIKGVDQKVDTAMTQQTAIVDGINELKQENVNRLKEELDEAKRELRSRDRRPRRLRDR